MIRRVAILEVNRKKEYAYVMAYAPGYDDETGWGYDGKGDGQCNMFFPLDGLETVLGMTLPEGKDLSIKISIDMPDELKIGAKERTKKKYS